VDIKLSVEDFEAEGQVKNAKILQSSLGHLINFCGIKKPELYFVLHQSK